MTACALGTTRARMWRYSIGVSAGAVNAALFAWNATLTGTAQLEQIWRSIRRRDLLRVQPGRTTMAAVGRRPSFFDSRPGETLLRRHLGRRLIEHSPVPLAIVATNLHDGRPVAMTDGDAASAVVASCSFPAIYPPMRRGDQWLIDSGVVALASGTPRFRAIDLLFRASTFGATTFAIGTTRGLIDDAYGHTSRWLTADA